jgi:hypothetical protein
MKIHRLTTNDMNSTCDNAITLLAKWFNLHLSSTEISIGVYSKEMS